MGSCQDQGLGWEDSDPIHTHHLIVLSKLFDLSRSCLSNSRTHLTELFCEESDVEHGWHIGQYWAMVGLYDHQPVETLDSGDRQTWVGIMPLVLTFCLEKTEETQICMFPIP